MKRRKRFNVRERQHRRYVRQVVALRDRNDRLTSQWLTPILTLTPSFYRLQKVRINRIQHASHTRMRREWGPVEHWQMPERWR